MGLLATWRGEQGTRKFYIKQQKKKETKWDSNVLRTKDDSIKLKIDKKLKQVTLCRRGMPDTDRGKRLGRTLKKSDIIIGSYTDSYISLYKILRTINPHISSSKSTKHRVLG